MRWESSQRRKKGVFETILNFTQQKSVKHVDISCRVTFDFTRVLQKVLSLGLDDFSATFYQTYILLQTFKVFPLY